jgi:hypothetical protein
MLVFEGFRVLLRFFTSSRDAGGSAQPKSALARTKGGLSLGNTGSRAYHAGHGLPKSPGRGCGEVFLTWSVFSEREAARSAFMLRLAPPGFTCRDNVECQFQKERIGERRRGKNPRNHIVPSPPSDFHPLLSFFVLKLAF